MNPKCPLCGSGEMVVLDSVRVQDLRDLYCKSLGLEVRSEFDGAEDMALYACQACDLRSFQPLLAGSGKFYDILQREKWYYLDEKNEYEIARRFVRDGDKVLEIGPGRGEFAKKIPHTEYLGLELSATAAERAQLAGVEIVVQPVEAHAQTHYGAYDVVCSFQVLEHVADLRSFLEASVACLKEGGLFICSVPSDDSYVPLQPNSILNMPPHHVTRWTDRAIVSLARLYRLTIVAIEHDRLSDLHLGGYAVTILYAGLNRMLGRQTKLIDTSRSHKILWYASVRLSGLLVRGLRDPRARPWGHSVTATLRKTAAEGEPIAAAPRTPTPSGEAL